MASLHDRRQAGTARRIQDIGQEEWNGDSVKKIKQKIRWLVWFFKTWWWCRNLVTRFHRFVPYDGFCENCNSQIHMEGLSATEYFRDDNYILLWPLGPYACPSCGTYFGRVAIRLKPFEVTKEFEEIKTR